MENSNFTFLLILALVCFGVHLLRKMFKFPKIGAMCLISGGVKTGKSTLSVALTYFSEYKARHRRWKFRKFFQKLFKRPIDEEPLIYSNIPLAVPYVELTEDLILRKKRFSYGSVIYVCEASLLADSQMIKNMDLNERLLLFNKLIGHELKGGCIIYDTQSIADVHYSIKRCLSEYFYVHHLVKWIPFFLVAYIREDRYSEDGSIVTISDKDVEQTLTRVIIPKKTWKLFDCYCYSSLTDELPVENTVVVAEDLKVKKILSFKNSRNLVVPNKGDEE